MQGCGSEQRRKCKPGTKQQQQQQQCGAAQRQQLGRLGGTRQAVGRGGAGKGGEQSRGCAAFKLSAQAGNCAGWSAVQQPAAHAAQLLAPQATVASSTGALPCSLAAPGLGGRLVAACLARPQQLTSGASLLIRLVLLSLIQPASRCNKPSWVSWNAWATTARGLTTANVPCQWPAARLPRVVLHASSCSLGEALTGHAIQVPCNPGSSTALAAPLTSS